MFSAAAVQYMQKIDMGIAIVCMVNNTAIKLKDDLNSPFQNDYILLGNDSNDNCMFKPKNDTAVIKQPNDLINFNIIFIYY